MNTTLLAWTLCFAAFAAFSAAMPRHWRQLGLQFRHAPRALRWFAIAALTAALGLCLPHWNVARAVPIVLGLASTAAIVVALTLTFRPRALPIAVIALPMLSALIGLWP